MVIGKEHVEEGGASSHWTCCVCVEQNHSSDATRTTYATQKASKVAPLSQGMTAAALAMSIGILLVEVDVEIGRGGNVVKVS